mgnify:CR=1 FL=1
MPVNKIKVSVSDLSKRVLVAITQGDSRSRIIYATVMDGGSPLDLTGKKARFRAELPHGKVVIDDGCEVADPESGVVVYTLSDEMADSPAVITNAYFEVYDDAGYSLAASKMVIEVGGGVDLGGARPSDYVPELDRLKAEARDAIDACDAAIADVKVTEADAKRAAEGADAVASHQPRIGGAGTWEVWDAAAGAYADTGVSAQGPKGDKGATGPQGPAGPKGDKGAPGSDAPATDVQIDGTSITANGVANVPKAGAGELGVVRVDRNGKNGISLGADGEAKLNPASDALISARSGVRPITASNVDYAVKAAMCDGKGAAWTAAEQAAAKKRMGIEESGGSSDETARIWLLPMDNISGIPDEGAEFNVSKLISIYPDDYGDKFGPDDIVLCYGYIYSICVEPGETTSIFARRYRFC